MDTTLDKKFPAEQRITIRNPKDNRVITRPWRSAMHLVDRGWIIMGSQANGIEEVKKSSGEKAAPPVASTVKNNDELFTNDELRIKYKEIYNKKPFYKWDKEKLLEKIKDGTKKD